MWREGGGRDDRRGESENGDVRESWGRVGKGWGRLGRAGEGWEGLGKVREGWGRLGKGWGVKTPYKTIKRRQRAPLTA